jgi:hypothetical protein
MSTYITVGATIGTKETKTEGNTTPSTSFQVTSVQVQRLKQSTKTTLVQDEGEMGPEEYYPEGSGGSSEPPFDNNMAILNDLARGQLEMENVITQMALNSQIIQNNLSTIGASIGGGTLGHTGHQGGGASGSNGNVAGTSG